EVELFLTAAVRNLMLEQVIMPRTNVRVESTTNLLEIGFELDGILEDELDQILHAVIERKRFYRLESGALLSLENEEFSSVRELFTDLGIQKSDVQDGNMQVP